MATTTTSTSTGYFTTAAQFRTIGSAISGAIQAVGLVQTSDTGQINWTTASMPGSTYVISGYEIYRFSDSLQSTAPVFIKIEYGCAQLASYMGLWITVSTGTDGAGTPAGNISWRFQCSNGNTDISTRTSYFSGSTNRLTFALWPWPSTGSGQWHVFGVERTHDSSGADTGTGVHILFSSAGSTGLGMSQYMPVGTTTAYLPAMVYNGWYCSAPLTGGGSFGGNVYTYPIRTFGMYENLPCFNFIHFAGTDITVGSTVSVTNYDGNSRSYLAPGMVNSTIGWFAYIGSSLTTGVAMRYE